MASVKRKLLRASLLVALGCAVVWLVRITDARYILRTILARIQDLGPLGPLVFILTYVIACLTFFPGFILTLGAGILFGLVWGTIYVCTGATIGACCAFVLSRYVARDWVYHRFYSNPNFRAIDDAVERDGWKVVGLIRLSPVFPFIPMNFIFGLTKIPLLHFAFATALGMVPVCAMFVYLGTLIGDIAALGNQPIATGKAKWIVSAVGLVTTIIVTVVVTRIARRALARAVPDVEI